MEKIADIRAQYRELIENDMEGNRAGALAHRDNMERSDLFFNGRFTSKTLQIPRLYSQNDIDCFRKIVNTAYGIFCKVINEYLHNADYRELFKFSKELEELILIPGGYDSLLPVARFDIFYHEETGRFYFCEINTDGTSGMNEDRLQNEFILHNRAHQEMRRRYEFVPMELFDSWVDTFLSLYRTYESRVDDPNVVITDFLENGTQREFEEFARRFQKAGVNCEICDIRSFTYSDGRLLTPSGHTADAVYRRAVTADIMKHYDEVQPFISAVKDRRVFLAGSFCTQIIHHKMLFYVLHLERTRQFLTPEENAFVAEHIPYTAPFEEGKADLAQVIENKDSYILKPEDSYASQGVFAGVEFDADGWSEKVRSAWNSGYVVQQYCPQHSAYNIDFAFGDGRWKDYIDMAGLYVYNGVFAGVFSRAAEGSGIIASHRNERTQATYIVKERI